MSWQDCIAEIKGAAGPDSKLTHDDIERILETVIARARRRSATGMPDIDSVRVATRDVAGEMRDAGKIEKRNALINLRARIGRRQRIAAAPDLVTGIKAEIHGVNTPIAGGRFSAEAEGKALARVYVAGAVTELERAGLLRAARSKALERDWARELFELSKGEDGRPGITGSAEALKIAQVIDKYQEQAKQRLNKAGAAIGDYSGYITRTSHDPDKIRRAGLDAWKQVIRAKLDPATFDNVGIDPAAQERFLDNVYHALITGVHLTHEGMQGFKDPEFTGPGNLAKRLSQERVLHFRDADAWLDYHAQFGGRSLIEDVIGSLERSARATALMHHFGTNPRAEFAADLRYFAEQQRNSDPAAVTRLREAEHDLQNRFDFLDGTANMPVNRLGARIGSAVRVWTSMAKLGGVMLTHLPVGALKAAELRYQGIGLLRGYGDYAASFFRGRGFAESETRQVMDRLLAGVEGMQRDLLSRFEPDDGVPGTLSKLANSFFKLTGLSYVLNAQRAGAEFTMSRHLGALLDREHAAMPADTQRVLSLFGIGDKEWSLLRQAPDHAAIDGRAFLTPDAATRIPDAAVIQHLFDSGAINSRVIGDPATMRKVNAFRDELALRLASYFTDRSAHVVIEPGIATRADILRGFRPGTPEGEAVRFIAQFKTWPAALVRMGLGREIYGGQSRPAAIAGVLHMALAGTVLGYLAMTLKDLAKGRTPRDPDSPKTWAAAMMQGGGLGILGDFLFGEYNRFGQNFTETLAGPVIGQGINSVLELWNRAKNGQDLKAELFRDMLNNTPFINLFYTRLALDYLFLWQVQEALNPGFIRRFERTIRQRNNQTFWLSPSAAVTPGRAPHHRHAAGGR
ncbi:MAG TPA: hypothetical protein VMI30_05125 [Stellaceae bacterium]|nr:hypothetical protein [Stellaceae bacterium]